MESSSIFALSLALISLVISMKYLNLYEKLSDNTKQLSITCGSANLTSPTLLSIQQNLDLNDNEFESTLKNNKESIQNLLKTNNNINSKSIVSSTANIQSKPVSGSVENNPKTQSSVSLPNKSSNDSVENKLKTQTPPSTSNNLVSDTVKNKTKTQTSVSLPNKSSSESIQNKPKTKSNTSSKSNQPKKKNVESFENYNYLSIDQRGLSNYNFSDLIYPINNKDDNTNLDMNSDLDEETKIDKTLQYIYQFHDTKEMPVKINNDFIKQDDIERDGLRYGDRFLKKNWCMVNHDDTNYCFDLYKKKNCNSIGEIVETMDKCNNKRDLI